MTDNYACWVEDYEEEEDALAVETCFGVEHAARVACQHWESHGRWSGDPVPDLIDVSVRDSDGTRWVVNVGHDYSIDFHTSTPTRVGGGQ